MSLEAGRGARRLEVAGLRDVWRASLSPDGKTALLVAEFGKEEAKKQEHAAKGDTKLLPLAQLALAKAGERAGEDGRKVKRETLIFPRYHQLQAVRRLVAAAAAEGPGQNYLIEHSAGSGKSNTIAWLAHRLSSLHDALKVLSGGDCHHLKFASEFLSQPQALAAKS